MAKVLPEKFRNCAMLSAEQAQTLHGAEGDGCWNPAVCSSPIILWNKTIDSLKDWSIQAWGLVHSMSALRTLRGLEAMNMIRKSQIQGVEKGDIQA